DEGRAVVLLSHDLRLVATLADQVLLLAGGRPVARGSVDEVLTPDVLARAGLQLPPLLAAWPAGRGGARGVLGLREAQAAGDGVAAGGRRSGARWRCTPCCTAVTPRSSSPCCWSSAWC